MKERYSGESSRKIWRIINSVSNKEKKEELTTLVRNLQQLEITLLRELNNIYEKKEG